MSLKTYYQEKSVPILKEELKISNKFDLPKLNKVVVSVGLSDARFNKDEAKERIETLEKITGQKPLGLAAKKAISNFKIRQGQIIAYMVTLRGERMYDFIDKLINIVLPRIRDFRGIPTYSFDKEGNLSMGIKEQIAFPEIKIEEVNKTHGLGITFVTTAKDTVEAKSLIRALGAVLSEEKRKKEEEKLETIQEVREKREIKAKEIKEEKKEEVKEEKIKKES